MVFSNLLKTSSAKEDARLRRSPTPESPKSPLIERPLSRHSRKSSAGNDELPYITDLSQIPYNADAEPPSLRELNNCLEALAAIFPDVQVEVFREMLSTFGEESRLAVVTEALIKNKGKWASGRWKVDPPTSAETVSQLDDKKESEDTTGRDPEGTGILPVDERFRTPVYQLAAKNAAYAEFKGLSHSTVKAVLAENNHSYLRARPTLAGLHNRTWRFSITSLFTRKKAPQEAGTHWVVWQSTGLGSIVPTLRTTGCAELDTELFRAFVAPMRAKYDAERMAKDRKLAVELNTKEAEEADAMHDCECCLGSTTFEELSSCSEGGHFVCFGCIRHGVNEAVFGQGWGRNVDYASGSLRCMAAVEDECKGVLSTDLVQRAILEQEDGKGKNILRKFEQKLAEDALLKSGVPLIRCPFCSYAEVDELYIPPERRTWRFRRPVFSPTTFAYVTSTAIIFTLMPFLIPLLSFLFVAAVLAFCHPTVGARITSSFRASLLRLRRRQHTLRFQCQSPSCGRASCTACAKPWRDPHICHESSLLSLRKSVELAMSLAVKRTCPRCNTSFVKSAGCNKLTCTCGYQMCYVCRKHLGGGGVRGAEGEGYRHFCEHFRPAGGRCQECSKCDLYALEDEAVVVRRAKEAAEREWLEREARNDEVLKRKLLERKERDGGGNRVTALVRKAERLTPEMVLDWVVEMVVQ
jgi:hypothetical protein